VRFQLAEEANWRDSDSSSLGEKSVLIPYVVVLKRPTTKGSFVPSKSIFAVHGLRQTFGELGNLLRLSIP